MKKLTTEKFIEKSIEKHGDLYGYDDVVYINTITKVKIYCNKCEDYFEQTPRDHIYGDRSCGCPICGNDSKKLTKEQFIAKARERHGNLYKYDDVVYININTKIKIWCNKCNKHFEQTPHHHINHKGRGCGCPDCNPLKRLTNEEVINKLTIEEDPIVVSDIIKCRCTYCKEYFVPIRSQLRSRISSLSGKGNGENRLYCSNTCKNACPIFKKSKYYDDVSKPDRSREVQPELRKMVLERDGHICQRCDLTEDLHCHHYEGIEINPIESADIDNCITLCHSCHNKVHSSGQCEVRRKSCKI